jgi:hypothetical protein
MHSFCLFKGVVIKSPEANSWVGLKSGMKFFENLEYLESRLPCWLESERETQLVLAGL